ncbi:MAG: class I mannose-6-phosphate isomerase [Erysipelotrichaceae bacterium]|nr:class I mannose-6-phosphate isomerase [Erysipelotrichaceae bacterium]MCD8573978.1 class I mannose-6-phosphate isomerase [Erysipelotrichaceae bacterium]
MENILKVKPHFKEKIWGGSRLNDRFNFDSPYEKTGECWAVSGISEGETTIEGGTCDGQSLNDVYKKHPAWFGFCDHDTFPILVKIIDVQDDLSIQVHPNDHDAQAMGYKHGKAEAWYILEATDRSEVVLGHTCSTREELEYCLNHPTDHEWLNRFNIRSNQFYYLPGGTIHGKCAHTLLYEIEQNSDIGFRIYDYKRLDQTNQPRPLHRKEALSSIKIPDITREVAPTKIITSTMKHTSFLKSEHFIVEHAIIDEDTHFDHDSPFTIIGFLSDGGLNGVEYKAGDHVIVLNHCKAFSLTSGSEVMLIHMPKTKEDVV